MHTGYNGRTIDSHRTSAGHVPLIAATVQPSQFQTQQDSLGAHEGVSNSRQFRPVKTSRPPIFRDYCKPVTKLQEIVSRNISNHL